MRTLIALSFLVSSGCGAAVVSGEGARVAACLEAEDAIIDRGEAGEYSRQQVQERVQVTRDVCDLLARKLREAGDLEPLEE